MNDRFPPPLAACASLVACLALGACTGEIAPGASSSPTETASDAGSSTTGSGAASGSGGSATKGAEGAGGATSTASASSGGSGGEPGEPGAEVSAVEFTRLTRAEYGSTVLQALGLTPDLYLIPEDGRVGPFTSNFETTPDPVHPYMLAAEELAAAAVPDTLPSCDPERAATCVTEDYADVLGLLFRRSLGESELEAFARVIEEVADGGSSAEAGTRAMLASALLSPDFLYRASPAAGDADADAALARRLAERLSFALWDAPPDADLASGVVASGSLSDELAAQAQRLGRDERATPVLARFVGQWLDVDTDLRLEDPDFGSSPDYLELLAFVEDMVASDAPVTDLVGGTRGIAHRDNLDRYGLEADDGAGDIVGVTWPVDSSRRGILGEELFAGSTRHPDVSRREIFRGLLVRRALLCDTIPAPSAELVALAGEVGDRTQDSRCRNCHLRLDPIGRAFVDLDPDIDEPAPPAEVFSHDELEGSYDTAGDLLEAIATSRAFAECFASNWLAFFLERPRADIDAAFVALLADRVQAGASLGDVIEATVIELHDRSRSLIPWCEGS